MACANKDGAKRVAVDKPKVKVFSRRRKYLRQTNGVSDQRKRFAVAAAGAKVVKDNVHFVGATIGRPYDRAFGGNRRSREQPRQAGK